jgi:putative oxidoreductase
MVGSKVMMHLTLKSLEPIGLLAGRLMLATIFLHEGVAKLGNYAGSAAYARSFGVPDTLLPLAIITELGCGLLIALGLFTRLAALALAGFCVFTAAVFHTKFTEINQLLHFEKNLAMAGGLLVLAVCGPGPFSIGKPFGR